MNTNTKQSTSRNYTLIFIKWTIPTINSSPRKRLKIF